MAQFILAGRTLGAATLSRFFAFHVFFIPAMIFVVLGFHLYLILRNGISEPPKAGRPVDPATYRAWYRSLLQREGRPYFPDAAWREFLFGFVIVVVIVVLAIVVGPPALQGRPDPTVTQAYPRPDWYFLWYFALLALIPPTLEDIVIVLFPLVVGAVLVLLPFLANRGERSPVRRPWAIAAVLSIALAIGLLWNAGERASWSPDLAAGPIPQAVIGSTDPAVVQGAQIFRTKGCESCHSVGGYGGRRGPDLTDAADRIPEDVMIVRIVQGKGNMPAYGNTLTAEEFNAILAFLRSRHGERTAAGGE